MENEIKNLVEMYKIKGKRNVSAFLVVAKLNNLLNLCDETKKDAYRNGWNDCRSSVENVLGRRVK